MPNARTSYQDRKSEILSYLDIVEGIEVLVREGTPIITAISATYTVTPEQQRMLYAGVYLHLYNMVESTVTILLSELEAAATGNGSWDATALTDAVRREWTKSLAMTNEPMNAEHRLEKAMLICDHFAGAFPLSVKITKGGGGNWDDDEIARVTSRLGLPFVLPQPEYARVKRPVRDDKGPLKLVTDLRNKLAHGSITFSECGANHTVADLRDIADVVFVYLDHLIVAFSGFISRREFLASP